ncbi:MAG: hypothetical protein HDR03_00140 [Lachnospiraceae bacterium]|nr:hypothetical protein [Lachnospiraceae bacterium]
MKKKLLAKIAKLAMLTFAAVIIVTGSDAMTVNAMDWNGWTDSGDNPANPDDWDMTNDGKTEEEKEEERKKKEEEQKALKELLTNDKYADVNTLNATVKIKTNILKAKKKAGSYVKQTPKPSKVVVNGKALKYNKKTKEYVFGYSLWDEDNQKWTDVDSLTAPGLYRLGIGGRGSYSGIYTKRIYVYDTTEGSKSMSSVKVKVNKVQYSGEEITSGVITSVKLGKTNLEEGKDYTVKYLNNVNSGTGIVRLTAVEGSGLVGEKEVNFTITGGTKISKAKVIGLTSKTYNYGKAVKQDMSQVKLTVNGKELEQDKDYAVQYYMNNTKIGTAKIVIAGKGSYYGTITKSFKITKIPITEEMLDDESKAKVKGYTGKPVKTGVGLFDSNRLIKTANQSQPEQYQLKEKTDYTLSYKNNVKPSDKAVIIVKGKGNYTGTINVYFTIQDKSKSADTQKAAGKDSVTKPETDEDVTDAPEEAVTDEEVTDTTEEPTDTEESENDETPDTEENPADDETPADEGTENGTGDEEGTDATDEPADTEENPTEDETPADEGTEKGADDEKGTASDETDNTTGSEDTGNTATDEGTGSTDEGDAVTDETVSTDTDSEDANSTTSDDMDNADSTLSDDAVTDAETQADVETVIPENSVVEDADTDAA